MDSEDKRDRDESSTSPECVIVQDLKVNVSPPNLGSDNPELGTKALTQAVTEVLEGVFGARIRYSSGFC
ncbi:hypothetical protein PVK06_001155 [Gossypium arboreum]|uniref:Uncharacterized protein n=1 Tax=Gossypium arboreum TaxID=29729 RepID=A0ABR0R0C0_GOSAR|nr:hypothetical protein PVK06_001155 [Gossypium arboreum]